MKGRQVKDLSGPVSEALLGPGVAKAWSPCECPRCVAADYDFAEQLELVSAVLRDEER